MANYYVSSKMGSDKNIDATIDAPYAPSGVSFYQSRNSDDNNSANVDVKNNALANNLQSPGINEGEISIIVDDNGNRSGGAGQGITIANNDITPAQGKPAQWSNNSYAPDFNGVVRAGVSLNGSGGADVFTAPNIASRFTKLFGGNGNDILTGGNSADYNDLFGEDGDDVLISGGKLPNTRYNYLIGGRGDDRLNLDPAKIIRDIVVYNDGDGKDTITNFNRANVYNADQLYFKGIANIDVVENSKIGNTEFRVGNGIIADSGFGTGSLMVSLEGTIGFSNEEIGRILFGSNFAFS
jgi:hypothetical protein